MLREKIIARPLKSDEDMELCRILAEVNVSGYTVVSKRTSVRLFVTIHRGPLQVVENQERKFLVGLSDAKTTDWFVNNCLLPRFFGLNIGRTRYNNRTHNALMSPYIKSKAELVMSAATRIRTQTAKINREVLSRVMAERADNYKFIIKRDIASACRLVKLNPVEFMQSILNEFVVESIVKS